LDFYILDARGRPQPEPDERRWSQWMESDSRRHVKNSAWEAEEGDIEVITVFLGFCEPGAEPPPLWETSALLFRKKDEAPEPLDAWLYINQAQALRGHDEMVRKLVGGNDPDWRRGIYGLLIAAVPIGFHALDMLDGRADGVVSIVRRCLRLH